VSTSNGSLFSANYYSVLGASAPPTPDPAPDGSPRFQGPTSTPERSPRAPLHQTITSSLTKGCPPLRASHAISPGSLYSPDLGSEAPIILGCLLDGHISGTAMVDCGATSQFIDQDFALKNGLKLCRKAVPEVLTVVDGRTSVAGDLIHEVTIQLLIDQHLENVVFRVTKLGSVPLILGKTWVRRHNPVIDWANNTVNFRSAWCQAHCLPHRHKAPEPSRATPAASSFSISMIGAAGYAIAARIKHSVSFVATIRDLFPDDDDDDVPGDSKQDMEKLRKIVPPEYHDHLLLFTKKEADKLPPHRYIDHEIPLEDGAKPSFGPLYSMSASELKEVRAWLREHLSKGFIRASQSSAASPILFVKKKDGSLRLCVDYRALNAITKKNRYPLPLIEETLRQVAGARYFTRLDLRSAFNLIRIKAGDEWKTAFRTRYGLFEFLVMPFGLTNAPASCQQFVNDTPREYLDIFCAVYIDDILIYSKS
jgi:hypothetical protein